MKDAVCLYSGAAFPLWDDPFPVPGSHISSQTCLSDPEVSSWVTLSHVCLINKNNALPRAASAYYVFSHNTTIVTLLLMTLN